MVMHPTAGVQIGFLNPGWPPAGSAGRPVICAQSDPLTLVQTLLSTNFLAQTFDPPSSS